MFKFEVKNRFTGDVQFIAELEKDTGSYFLNLGLAIKWALQNKADLRGAHLRGADLRDTNITGADLTDANLTVANLTCADLTDANLTGANLTCADLRRANLTGANITGADLTGAVGNGKNIKLLQIEKYIVIYTSDVIQIGCRRYSIEEWRNFDNDTISDMDTGALDWWNKWKEMLFKIIEMSPAEPTKDKQND